MSYSGVLYSRLITLAIISLTLTVFKFIFKFILIEVKV